MQRKQARTGGERDDDDEGPGEPESEDSDADDDNDIPYNPKNLPLGWDGKVHVVWYWNSGKNSRNFSRNILGRNVLLYEDRCQKLQWSVVHCQTFKQSKLHFMLVAAVAPIWLPDHQETSECSISSQLQCWRCCLLNYWIWTDDW